jgi:hypothetical protein
MRLKKDKVVDRQISNSGVWAALLSRSCIDRQDYTYELMKTEFVYRHRYSQQPLITNSSGISFGRRHEVILQMLPSQYRHSEQGAHWFLVTVRFPRKKRGRPPKL